MSATPAKTPVAPATTDKKPPAAKSAAGGALKIPANFESNPAFDEETKAKFRRELAA
jgi:hypothetical protein